MGLFVRLCISDTYLKAFPFTLKVYNGNAKNPIYFDEEILAKHCKSGIIDYCKIDEKGERASSLLNLKPIALGNGDLATR